MVLEKLPKPNNNNRVVEWSEIAEEVARSLARSHRWSLSRIRVPPEFGEEGHSGGICFCLRDRDGQIMAITKYHDFTETTVQFTKKCGDELFTRTRLAELANSTKTVLVIHRSF